MACTTGCNDPLSGGTSFLNSETFNKYLSTNYDAIAALSNELDNLKLIAENIDELMALDLSAAIAVLNQATAAANGADTALANAETVYDSFDDRFLGAKASAPTVDNDGDPLVTGAMYFNTTDNQMYIWNGSSWISLFDILPSQTGNGGKYLKTDGSALSWTNVYAEITHVSPDATIDTADGTIQSYTLVADVTLAINIQEGESITLHLSGANTYTATWPAMVWVNGLLPQTVANCVITIWKFQGIIYGAYVGSL